MGAKNMAEFLKIRHILAAIFLSPKQVGGPKVQ